jgi:hypothetical protein
MKKKTLPIRLCVVIGVKKAKNKGKNFKPHALY